MGNPQMARDGLIILTWDEDKASIPVAGWQPAEGGLRPS